MPKLEDVPALMVQLMEDVAEIKRSLIRPETKAETPVKYLTAPEAAAHIRLSIHSLYSLKCQGKLPHLKRANKLLFIQTELDEWLKNKKVSAA